MNLILVPGFWLGASSWDGITPALESAGHTVTALTLPGLESVDADRSNIGLAQHVAAVVAAIDATDEPVVLVGHSGGGTVIHAAVDQRPDRVTRAIYVDTLPLPNGHATNAEIPAVGADIPLPPWEVFREGGSTDLDGLTPDQLADFRRLAVPHPRRAAQDVQVLTDERRFDVPVTVVATTWTRALLDGWIAAGEDYVAEFPRLADLTIVELPTGHWPQFSTPDELARAVLGAL